MVNDALILVTRTGEEGQSLADMLRTAQVQVRHFAPVVLAGPEDAAACRQALLAALPVDLLVAPSAQALRESVALVGIDILADLALVVPGEGTAELARSLGFQKVIHPPGGGTSEEMLALPALQQVEGRRVLILAAAGGRTVIQQRLAERDAAVQRLHVYRRVPQSVPEALAAELGTAADPIVLLASGGALQALAGTLARSTWSQLCAGLMVAPSERVAAQAREHGAQHVVCASGADHQSMLRALASVRKDLDVCGTLDKSEPRRFRNG